MHLSYLTVSKIVSLSITSVAGPVIAFFPNAGLSSRANLPLDRCQNLDHPTSSRCWEILQVENYLTDWAESTPDCIPTSSTGSGCCFHQNETWSTCFLRLATGKAVHEDGNYDSRHSFDCDSLLSKTCSRDILLTLDRNLDPTIRAPVAYVKNAIYEIWAVFKAYSDGEHPCTSSTVLN